MEFNFKGHRFFYKRREKKILKQVVWFPLQIASHFWKLTCFISSYSCDDYNYFSNNLRVGAVGNVKKVKNAISLARAVMKYTTSTLLTGEERKYIII